MKHRWYTFGILLLVGVMMCTPGCDGSDWDWDTMEHQPKYEPYSPSTVLPDGSSSQLPPQGTVSRHPPLTYQESRPRSITMTLLKRGQERFNIYCAVCHGEDGYGQGMVVRRGFPQPPSLHELRLRKASDHYLYDVITRGRGKMASYQYELPPADRQAVVAYIRALQLSQHAPEAMVPPEDHPQLDQSPPVARVNPADPPFADDNNTPPIPALPADTTPAAVPREPLTGPSPGGRP